MHVCTLYSKCLLLGNTASLVPARSIIINVPDVRSYGAGRNDFDAAKSISRAIGRGGPLKSRLSWALQWPRAKRVPFGAQNSQNYLDAIRADNDSKGLY
jgi:hypothetical protein